MPPTNSNERGLAATPPYWRTTVSGLVGAARALSDGEREALIVGVAVLPEYQRRGIGTAMMRDLIERLNGCAIILTSSEDENTPFYRRLGFRTHKRTMVLHYPDDVVID